MFHLTKVVSLQSGGIFNSLRPVHTRKVIGSNPITATKIKNFGMRRNTQEAEGAPLLRE